MEKEGEVTTTVASMIASTTAAATTRVASMIAMRVILRTTRNCSNDGTQHVVCSMVEFQIIELCCDEPALNQSTATTTLHFRNLVKAYICIYLQAFVTLRLFNAVQRCVCESTFVDVTCQKCYTLHV